MAEPKDKMEINHQYIPGKEPSLQAVEPTISKAKFDLEVAQLLQASAHQAKRGILILGHEFPNVTLSFFCLKMRPAPLIFSVEINFINYDLEPPSVKFIDIFTGSPIKANQLIHQFPRKIGQVDMHLNLQPLIVAQADGIPFFCIPGVREYHKHPAHTGDNWLLHRGIGGEGTLGFIVEKLYQYGISAINGYQLQVTNPTLTVTFDALSIPE